MNVTSIRIYSINKNNNNYKNKKDICFAATPKQILDALDAKGFSHSNGTGKCYKKTDFVSEIVNFFNNIQSHLTDKFNYRLGEVNNIPDYLDDIEINNKTLKKWDADLNDPNQRFQCGGGCPCGEKQTQGQFLADLLEILGVPNPRVIELFPAA